jgi:hypothetical protein
MSGRDDQRPRTHQIASRTVNPRLVHREPRDLTTVLQILRISEQHHALDLILNSSTQTGYSAGYDRGTLRVAACCDGSIGAFGGSEIEKAPGFSNSNGGGTSRECILGDPGCVGTAYALDPDVGGAVGRFEGVSCEWAYQDALWLLVSGIYIR